jgi:hypothetical protein
VATIEEDAWARATPCPEWEVRYLVAHVVGGTGSLPWCWTELRVPMPSRRYFDPLPGEGRWGAALLLDGNVGIGGDPATLLRRVRELLGPGGVVVAEVEPPGTRTEAIDVRVERAADAHAPATTPGPWFRWARVGADGIVDVMDEVGLVLADLACCRGRWLAHGMRA